MCGVTVIMEEVTPPVVNGEIVLNFGENNPCRARQAFALSLNR